MDAEEEPARTDDRGSSSSADRGGSP